MPDEGTRPATEPKLDPLKQLFGAAWHIYRDRAAVLLEIVLIPTIVAFAGAVIASLGHPFAFVGDTLYVIGYFFLSLSPVPLIYALHHEANVDVSYKAFFELFWATVWVGLLVIFAVLGGFVMLIVPGIMLSVSISFALYTLVIEHRRGVDALRQSREYVKGYWWAVFGRTILLTLLLIFVSAVVEAPFTAAFGQSGANAVSLIVTLFLTPFSVAYSYAMFKNLRALKPAPAESQARAGRGFIITSAIVGVACAVALLIYYFVYTPGGLR